MIALSVLLWAIAPAEATELPYSPLEIGGQSVRWQPNTASGGVMLRYAIARAEVSRGGIGNCDRVSSPDRILAGSAISRAELATALRAAFDRWQRVADISFVEAEEAAGAHIVIGEQVEPAGAAYTSLLLAPASADTIRPIEGATICLNPARRWKIGFDGNLEIYDLVHTLAHEIGHAIGLDHPGPRGQLMSFRYSETQAGLGAGDVLGAEAIYGRAGTSGVTAMKQDVVAGPVRASRSDSSDNPGP